MQNNIPDIPSKLMATANHIVWFAVAQTIAYALATANQTVSEKVGQLDVAFIVLVATFGACVVYNLIVWWCYKKSVEWYETIDLESHILSKYKQIIRQMTIWWSVLLVLFWGVSASLAFLLYLKNANLWLFK